MMMEWGIPVEVMMEWGNNEEMDLKIYVDPMYKCINASVDMKAEKSSIWKDTRSPERMS